MTAARQPGMDHSLYEFSSIVTRKPLRWPDGARVAFCVIVNLEHYELQAPEDAFTLNRRYGPARMRPFPDITRASYREYGNRVGIFGIMKLLDRYGIKATAAMDAVIAESNPFLVNEVTKRDWDVIGHGVTANRLITSQMSEEQEREHIARCVRAIEKATGRKPSGWLGVEYSESTRTPHLLAEHGVRYVCDWTVDEQPYAMNVEGGTLYSLPVTTELDDHTVLGIRNVPITDYTRIAADTFDVLYREGARNGRLLVYSIHPWIMGQPYRLKYLDRILAHVTRRKRVWKATGAEIIDWYAGQHAT
jgi:allantoinase